LTEVKFLHLFSGEQAAPKDQNFVRLDIFGRTNNAYRWAGETDVFEAVNAFLATETALNRSQMLDPARVVLRGFSMGGAGTWHLGLHRPDRWCVLGPGAGFTSTHGYLKDLPDNLPYYQEDCLRIYDAVDYAENVANVPVVAFSGKKDPQIQAARNIESRLKALGLKMEHIEAPDLGHKFPPEWQKKVEQAFAPIIEKGRDEYPTKVRFVTCTLKYSSCAWVEILGLERHYRQARVEAERNETGFIIKTGNIRGLHLTLPEGSAGDQKVQIDGQELTARPWLNASSTLNVYLERVQGKWKAVLPQKIMTARLRHRQKVPGLQGPIDDAFSESFVCVRGTGTAWHESTGKYAEANLERFRAEWSKYLRGD